MHPKSVARKIASLGWLLLFTPKKWWKPERRNVLIYDAAGSDPLLSYLQGHSVGVIYVRGEQINVYCAAMAVLEADFWQGRFALAYTVAFARAAQPKLILTSIDNSKTFWLLSNRLGECAIKTIFVQNGVRGESGDVFDRLAPNSDYHVDFMLTFGSAVGTHYRRFISGAVLPIGSLRNNLVPRLSEKSKSVVFISNFHTDPSPQPYYFEADGTPVFHRRFFETERQVLAFLDRWCKARHLKLSIAGRSTEPFGDEYLFFTSCLAHCDWEFVPRTAWDSSYRLADSAELVVAIDSTLGYESLARGNRTAILSCRGGALHCQSYRFGWPAELPDSGPFWTNRLVEEEFARIMEYLVGTAASEWERTRVRYTKDLLEYDAGNARFSTLLENLLSCNGCNCGSA